ncbi:FMN-linked oxidoreductases superfamily protein [Dorcoceras hygrometricum]|uniref:FMN-linked oxidoreductases superfamily protein n=1 Tax=Dorcoceras hygrometricum TaxID=472368 RepID=A0A2Z7D4R8_9LAMI|nr:FMN-linked oxidoreductases superfamily protein [Dorcoceras hygrometricum]
MLHSRIFSENKKCRSEEFTTCKEDRPLLVQFCTDDPDILPEAMTDGSSDIWNQRLKCVKGKGRTCAGCGTVTKVLEPTMAESFVEPSEGIGRGMSRTGRDGEAVGL